MDFQSTVSVFLVLFFAFLLIFRRKHIVVNKIVSYLIYFVMYRGKWGISFMDRAAGRFPRAVKYLGAAGIAAGYLGIVAITFLLFQNLFSLLTRPEAVPGVMPVLPFKAKGIFYVPPLYWIISIFFLAVVHEFSHGLLARRHGIPIKSSGWAFLGVIVPLVPAAFVEPDEKKLNRASAFKQLSVYAAGPFANILTAVVLGLLMFALVPPLSDAMMQQEGVKILSVGKNESYPARMVGMSEEELILSVDGKEVRYTSNFTAALADKEPGERIEIVTDRSSYELDLIPGPANSSKGFMGITVYDSSIVKPGFSERYGTYTGDLIIWVIGLLNWLIILNLGVGLFNFIPLGPIDGGRMLFVTLRKFLSKDNAQKIFSATSTVFLVLLLINLGFAFFR